MRDLLTAARKLAGCTHPEDQLRRMFLTDGQQPFPGVELVRFPARIDWCSLCGVVFCVDADSPSLRPELRDEVADSVMTTIAPSHGGTFAKGLVAGVEFRELTLEQVQYDERRDCRITTHEGLSLRHDQGWELVTSYQGKNYAGGPGSTVFVFRKLAELEKEGRERA